MASEQEQVAAELVSAIKKAQQLGFSKKEIQNAVSLALGETIAEQARRSGDQAFSEVLALLEKK